MIDWFVLTLPLAALPVILIFGFVGCVLDRSGADAAVAPDFIYPAGLDKKLVSLTVKMTLSVNGDSQFDTRVLTAVSGDLKPAGDRVKFNNLAIDKSDLGEIGAAFDVTCVCTILIVNQSTPTNVPVTPHPNIGDEQDNSGDWTDFNLVVTGTGFDPGDYSVQ
jgi:hypothetical protein